MHNYIHKLIDKNQGSISISDFMHAALYHSKYGYYMKKVSLGKDGDFITAPEISQLFGEIIAVWIIYAHAKLGYPKQLSLVELGPGKGTLMYDIVRVIKKYKDFFKSISIHLIDISPVLCRVQQQTLSGLDILWHKNIDDLPEQPTIFLANEFFDSLPIYQFIYYNEQWYENRVVGYSDGFKILAMDFHYDLLLGIDNLTKKKLFDGAVVEVCPTGIDMIKKIKRKIYKDRGAALIIDYGYVHPPYKNTLQAVKQHNYVDFFHDIGNCDITALVDFQALKGSLQNVNSEILTQREFLYSFGIRERAQLLMKKDNKIFHEFLRLTENMGTLFKAMLIYS